jgi:hypothetical protein
LIIGFVQNLILAYIGLVVFTAACGVLVEKGVVERKMTFEAPGPIRLW